MRWLVKGWQLSQITTLASAQPATATIFISGAPFSGAAFNTSLNGFGGSNRVPFLPFNSLDIDQGVSCRCAFDEGAAVHGACSRLPEPGSVQRLQYAIQHVREYRSLSRHGRRADSFLRSWPGQPEPGLPGRHERSPCAGQRPRDFLGERSLQNRKGWSDSGQPFCALAIN